MIQVTMSFNTLAEALAALTAANGAAVPAAVSTSTGNAPAAKPAAPASAPAAAAPSAAKTQAAASPSPAPAPAPKADPAPATAETPSLAGEAGYKVLQAAVFELAQASRDAAMGIAASMGVKHMKDLAEERRSEALAAVKAKIAELKAAASEVA